MTDPLELIQNEYAHNHQKAASPEEDIQIWRIYLVKKYYLTHDRECLADFILELRGKFLKAEESFRNNRISLNDFLTQAQTLWTAFRHDLAKAGLTREEIPNVMNIWQQFATLENQQKSGQISYEQLCQQTEILYQNAINKFLGL